MNLDLTEEQLLLRDSLRKLLADQCTPKVVRSVEDDPVGYPAALWKSLSEMGLPGLNLDPEFGGSGLGVLETAIVYEELGRALCPSPLFVTSTLGGGLIARAGSAEQKKKLLPAIASGEFICTPAVLEPGNSFSANGIQVRAKLDGDTYKVSGTKFCVNFASAANCLLTLVRTGPGDKGIDILMIDPKSKGVSLTQTLTLARDAQYEVTFDNVAVPVSARLGAAGSGWEHWQAVMQNGMVALSAWEVGCGDRAVELATEYAKERVQFGRVIGSFQGVAHQLANAATAVAGARLLTHEAAWACDTGRPTQRLAAMAFVTAGEAGRFSTRTGHQVFGGIGFTLDIDIQLFYRRAKQTQIAWADPAALEEIIADDVIDGE